MIVFAGRSLHRTLRLHFAFTALLVLVVGTSPAAAEDEPLQPLEGPWTTNEQASRPPSSPMMEDPDGYLFNPFKKRKKPAEPVPEKEKKEKKQKKDGSPFDWFKRDR